MNYQTKNILKSSINVFLSVSDEEKENMVSHVRNQIKEHENALKHIGMGLADDYVQAGKIFLRIYDYGI